MRRRLAFAFWAIVLLMLKHARSDKEKQSMVSPAVVHFPPFVLDIGNERLWHGKQQLPLRPKPLAILRYLVERPGQLVTKEELLKAIWPQTYVSEGLLHTYLRDLRHVLNDDPEAPRFIETVVRRGYRFIALLKEERIADHTKDKAAPTGIKRPIDSSLQETISVQPSLVGREAALTALHERLGQALRGVRQIVFVTGEPGIGKTTLVDAFLEQVSARQDIWIGRGQCVAQYGAGEAYLPVLEALGRLCREAGGGQLVTQLRRYAPSWLVQLPALLTDSELETLQRKVQGVTKERMLRELAEALEVLTAEQPLVLVLEDLHWSDASTLDLLSAVARRREAARLLVVGTYRPADVIVSGHPLRAVKEELQLHGQCTELPLTFLSASDVMQYLAVRFPQSQFSVELGHLLHQHTEGNPLFLLTAIEDLVTRHVLDAQAGQWRLQVSLNDVALGVPTSVQQLMGRQVERLSTEEQQILEVASVAGEVFSAAAVAAGLETELERVEQLCEGLARQEQFLQAQELETWPDGTIAGRYRFQHALYQQAVYERIGAARRMRLHHRIGERLEAGYDTKTGEIAAELAVHFERGQDYQKAMEYLERAAQNAVQRSAYSEAIRHLTKGLELLTTLPATPNRSQRELVLQSALGPALSATLGFAAPEVEKVFLRIRELCQQLGETPQLFGVVAGLAEFHFLRGEGQTARELGEQLLRWAQSEQTSSHLFDAYRLLGCTSVHLGAFPAAQSYLEQGLALYDPQLHRPNFGCHNYMAYVLWILGYPDQALKQSHDTLRLATTLAHPLSLALVFFHAANLNYLRRDLQVAQEHAETSIAIATEHGFPHFVARAAIPLGWALCRQGHSEEGVARIRQGLASYRVTVGTSVGGPLFLAILAEAYQQAGQREESCAALAEALTLVKKNDSHFWEAELLRLKGELVLQSGVRGPKLQEEKQKAKNKKQKAKMTDPQPPIPNPQTEAEAYFLKAIDIARQQQAKSLELRATMSLSRLWQQQGKKKEAHQMLAEIYNWFTEGFDTKDLQEAKALLADLS